MDCSGEQVAMDVVKDLDLSQQTHVITGGDDGLGYETAFALASAKATVVLACRSQTKCPAAAKNITQATGNHKVSVIPLDLSSFASIRSCAAMIKKRVPRVDVLISNAGLLEDPKSLPPLTDDGFDRVFEVNYLGSYLLIQELLPLLRQSNARVVNVASIASNYPCSWANYLAGCESLDKMRQFAKKTPSGHSIIGVPASNYGLTKYLDVFTTAELARREQNITAFSLHPGVVSTGMTGSVPWLVEKVWCIPDFQKPCPRTVEQGATTQTYLATARKEELASFNGKYFDSCKVKTSVIDKYSRQHGEEKTLAYQSAIYDMADHLINPKTMTLV